MKLTSEEGRRIIYGDHEDWIPMEEEQLIEQSRWSVRYSRVLQHHLSGNHYRFYWSRGATEQQDEQPYEYEIPEPVRVVAKEVTTIEWMPTNEIGDSK